MPSLQIFLRFHQTYPLILLLFSPPVDLLCKQHSSYHLYYNDSTVFSPPLQFKFLASFLRALQYQGKLRMSETQFLIIRFLFALLSLYDITSVLPGPYACKLGFVLNSTSSPELQVQSCSFNHPSLGRTFHFHPYGNKILSFSSHSF